MKLLSFLISTGLALKEFPDVSIFVNDARNNLNISGIYSYVEMGNGAPVYESVGTERTYYIWRTKEDKKWRISSFIHEDPFSAYQSKEASEKLEMDSEQWVMWVDNSDPFEYVEPNGFSIVYAYEATLRM